jgi:transcriptional regulator with GAF, ATPase, and Fis domain
MDSDFLPQAGIVGDSPAMNTLAYQIDNAARSDLTVLVSGESGTGKELVAGPE